jgi:hypothetical protein
MKRDVHSACIATVWIQEMEAPSSVEVIGVI